jgi:retron-type reverse transcriptase
MAREFPSIENLKEAINQVLSPIYEKMFSTHDYGFHPNRNARQALSKTIRYIEDVTQG